MPPPPNNTAPTGRRAEYAQATQQAILDAARDLFVDKGYFGTKVEEIARVARVAPATVYAVGGGKHGLLRTLIESGTKAERIDEVYARMESIDEPRALVRFMIRTTRTVFGHWADLMRQVAAAAPQEPTVRETQRIAHEGMRAGLAFAAQRLADMGALRDDVDVPRATDLFWLHLCNTAYFVRTDDLGWSLDESETWLAEALPRALLAHP
ncbi:TetR/AcrR family transcriptional regulator [Umezawaea sp. Da 62-37]|uniref:TetR/AcrR family transcriptional regulator n=1 Tax=Umezawaea sp. Da 62-37 TaxID=3075927 RepID=UPI0028F747DD|nr:TetR/AcrR family transcriptional regulator [Umezawaea sp. Da 62-37]WNV86373.1 TetR/AcrR family transcriptional regulator [Umezawaea sp. Da 62-37]